MCDSINRKLGGPVIVSPPKSKQPKGQDASKKEAKPGTAAKRPAPARPRTLQRAFSNEQFRRSVSRGPSNAIALLRSATSTTIPGLKREGSEPLGVKSMVKNEGAPARDRRPSLALSRSNSMSSLLEDTKAQKQALVDAELQDAISALRKPNRGLAGKALVEAAEKRSSLSGSSGRSRDSPVL